MKSAAAEEIVRKKRKRGISSSKEEGRGTERNGRESEIK